MAIRAEVAGAAIRIGRDIARGRSRCRCLQEVWGTDETTQAHEFAAILGLHAGFAEPSYPAVPDPPHVSDHDGVTLGLGVLSRWPITGMPQVATPAQHPLGSARPESDAGTSGRPVADCGGLLGVRGRLQR